MACGRRRPAAGPTWRGTVIGSRPLGLVVAEEHVGHRLAAPLPGQPGLDDRGHVLGDPAGRERPAVDQHDDGRACRWRATAFGPAPPARPVSSSVATS